MEFLFGLIVNAVIWVIPLYRLLPRAGMSANLAWLGVIPVVGLILLWILAFSRWPGDAGARA
jgi:hypothetical protein